MPSLPSIPDTAKIKLLQCLGKEPLGLREHDIYAKLQEAGPPKGSGTHRLPSFHFFRCEMLVSGRVEIIEFCEELGVPFIYWIDF